MRQAKTNSKPFFSIILPTYNESGNILRLINEIKTVLKKTDFEIVLVDDDSPDKTGYLVKKNYSKSKFVTVIIRKKDHGLARSILTGIKVSKGKYVLVMDTDFNHDPKVLPRFAGLVGAYDLLIGSRYILGGGMENRLRFYLSYIYNISIRFILGLKTHDNLSGFFLIKKKCLVDMDLENIFQGYGDYFIRFLKMAHKNNLKINEIPVFYKNRTSGESKSRFLSMFVSYSQTVMDILKA